MTLVTRLDLGGAQQFALDLSRHLAASREWEVLLATGPGGELQREASSASRLRRAELPTLRRELDPRGDLKALRDLDRLITRWRPTVLHTHTSKAGILGRLAARFRGVPIILHTVHGWSFHSGLSAVAYHAYRALETAAARFSSRLHAVCRSDIRRGLLAGIERRGLYFPLPCGIELETFRPLAPQQRLERRKSLDLPAQGPIVGTVSCLKPQKDPLTLCCVIRELLRRQPGLCFVWIGDGAMRADVERALREALARGAVRLLGWRKDVSRWLPAMDVFALASRWEGLPLAVCEALACGVPVVATAVDGVPEAVRHERSGLLVTPHSRREKVVEELVASVDRLLRDPSLRARMAAHGRQTAAQFFDRSETLRSWDRFVRELLAWRFGKQPDIMG